MTRCWLWPARRGEKASVHIALLRVRYIWLYRFLWVGLSRLRHSRALGLSRLGASGASSV